MGHEVIELHEESDGGSAHILWLTGGVTGVAHLGNGIHDGVHMREQWPKLCLTLFKDHANDGLSDSKPIGRVGVTIGHKAPELGD